MKAKLLTTNSTARTISKYCKKYLCSADRVRIVRTAETDEVHYMYDQHPRNIASNGKWVFAGWLPEIIDQINEHLQQGGHQ